MKASVDTSVMVAALVQSEPCHEESRALLNRSVGRTRLAAWPHALLETFSNITGGRLSARTTPAKANRLIRESLLPHLDLVELSADELLASLDRAEAAGIRGGAVFDWMHLIAARKAGARTFYTLDLSDFRACARAGDPEVRSPAD